MFGYFLDLLICHAYQQTCYDSDVKYRQDLSYATVTTFYDKFLRGSCEIKYE